MNHIVVVDYGASNLRSVVRALEHVAGEGCRVTHSVERDTILSADRVVFPGQGAIGQCMRLLREKALEQTLLETLRDRPFLGICLGLQGLMEHSDEDGGVRGLGVFPGRVRHFEAAADRPQDKIPHMGWNRVRQSGDHPLWHGIEDDSHFYFVHSYYVVAEEAASVAGRTYYICDYASALTRGLLFATQFHPEKSQQAGLQLLRNFVHWNPS